MRRRPSGAVLGPSALDVLEDAVHLLRLAPAADHAVYFAGTLPFVLALLAFGADMAASAYAREHAAPGSLAVALAFLWMKAGQAAFCRRLLALRAGESAPPLGLAGSLRLLAAQAAVQPLGLVLVPASVLACFPAAWTIAFFQGFSVLGSGERPLRKETAASLHEAGRWPAQNHLLLVALTLLVFFALVNVALASAVLPYAARTLLGIETAATRSGTAAFNGTFLAVVLGLTYALVDPVVKAAYVVRCFHGVSVRSGLDLRAGIRALTGATPELARRTAPARARARGEAAAGSSLLLVLALASPGSALAQAPAPASTPAPAAATSPAPAAASASTVDEAALGRALHEVFERPEFSWRMPREKPRPDEQLGLGERIVRAIVRSLEEAFRLVGRFLGWVVDWVLSLLPDPILPESGSPSSAWRRTAVGLGYVLLTLSAILAAVLVARHAKRRRSPAEAPAATAPPEMPDVRDEGVTADQLPEDGWIELARDLLARGDRRAAVRALYLAGLAHLARLGLIRLARHKSNREYARELARREGARTALLAAFGDVVLGFERVWYGRHEASEPVVDQVAAGLERMRSDGA